MIRFLTAFSLSLVIANGAALRFGSETAVSMPSNSLFQTTMNFRPGNNETVFDNPPIFSWFYATNQLSDANPNGAFPHWNTQTNDFRLRITAASDTSFASPAVDVRTPFCDYNFLDPLDTNTTRVFIWKVDYITNGVVYHTGDTRTFHISATAVPWPRAIFGGTNYYFTNGLNVGYRAGQEAAVLASYANDSRMESDLRSAATAGTNAGYWHTHTNWPNNDHVIPSAQNNPSIDMAARANAISAVLNLWKFSAEARWTNASMTGWLETNLSHFIVYNLSNNYAAMDYGDSQSGIPPRLVPCAYAWMKPLWTAEPSDFRFELSSNLLLFAVRTVRHTFYNNMWLAWPFPLGSYLYQPTNDLNTLAWDYANKAYTNTTTTNTFKSSPASTFERQGNSHGSITEYASAYPMIVLASEHPEILFYAQRTLCNTWARTSPFGGWAANHIGVYGYVSVNIAPRSLLNSLMFMRVSFPQAQLERTEFLTRFPEWYTRLIPYGMRLYHGPYGDGAPNGDVSYQFGTHKNGLDLALVSSNGLARQLWDLNRGYSNTYWSADSHFDEIPLRSSFTLPPAATNGPVGVYLEDGYFSVSKLSPSEFGAATNGMSMTIAAAPRGPYGNHYAPHGAPTLYAKGVPVTGFGGAGLDDYGYRADANQMFLITNGYGSVLNAAPYSYSQREPWNMRISYIGTNNPICYFVGVDMLPGFTNYSQAVSQGIPDPRSNTVSKVNMFWAQVHSNYWVFCGDIGFNFPNTAALNWPVPWAWRYQAGSSPLSDEIAASGDRYLSNSFAMVTDGWDYMPSAIADANVPNPPRLPVFFRMSMTGRGAFVAKGTASLTVGTVEAIGTSATNSTLNPFRNRTFATAAIDRNARILVTNDVPATNVVMTGAVMYQESGESAPLFTNITTRTYSVTYKGKTEVISWGETNASPASTIIFDVVGAAEEQGGPGEDSTPGSAILRGVIMRGAFVK